jgi:hypothetical protein
MRDPSCIVTSIIGAHMFTTRRLALALPPGTRHSRLCGKYHIDKIPLFTGTYYKLTYKRPRISVLTVVKSQSTSGADTPAGYRNCSRLSGAELCAQSVDAPPGGSFCARCQPPPPSSTRRCDFIPGRELPAPSRRGRLHRRFVHSARRADYHIAVGVAPPSAPFGSPAALRPSALLPRRPDRELGEATM